MKSFAPEADEMINKATDNNFTYPYGFYIEPDKPTDGYIYYLDSCVENFQQAADLFEYVNTCTSRNFVFVSQKETDKYYEYKWDTGGNLYYYERIHKCNYFDQGNIDYYYSSDLEYKIGYFKILDKVSAKNFVEYYITSVNNSINGPEITDILDSSVTESTNKITVTIKTLNFFHAPDWGMCKSVYINEYVFDIYKPDGSTFTKLNKYVKTYKTGN